MAKFKSNYAQNSKGSSSFLLRLIIYGVVLMLLLLYLSRYIKTADWLKSENTRNESNSSPLDSTVTTQIDFLPSVTKPNELIRHHFFTLSYSERHEQAEWVAYELTINQLNASKQNRFDYFAPDLKIKTKSAIHRDYTGSGYTRGHLAPAADMAFNPQAAEECFYMSNISPQLKAFNNGIWRELEENVRDWARKNKRLYIVTGPVLTDGIRQKIGTNRVSVPTLFYKVLLDHLGPDKKGIAFLIPNERSERPLEYYACSIDSIEHLTHINFFQSMQELELIESIEYELNIQAWPIDQRRYSMRLSNWNKQD